MSGKATYQMELTRFRNFRTKGNYGKILGSAAIPVSIAPKFAKPYYLGVPAWFQSIMLTRFQGFLLS